MNCILYVNYAGACRYLGQSLTGPSTSKETLSRPLVDSRLPVGLANHSHPMSSRILDVNLLFLLQVARQTGLYDKTETAKVGARVSYVPSKLQADLVGMVFQASMLRFTGRVKHYRTYARYTNADVMVPLPKDLPKFLAFMNRTVPRSKNGKRSIGQWLSSQHKSCIPNSTRSLRGFSAFATALVKELPSVVESMLDNVTRSQAVIILKNYLQLKARDGAADKLHWMAQQIVADVDEVFDDAFGGVIAEGVVKGYGSHVGHILMKNADTTLKFDTILENLVSEVNASDYPKEHLEILGLKRLESGVVVHKQNGRPYNGTDGEASACKLYSAAKLTFGAYSTSPYPFFSKPHCHPVRLHPNDKIDAGLENGIREIMESSVKAMWACTSTEANVNIALTIPEFCLRPGEREWREQSKVVCADRIL